MNTTFARGVGEPRRDRRPRKAREDRYLDRADVRARMRGDRRLRRHRQEGSDRVALRRRRARAAPRRVVAPRARAPPTSATAASPSSGTHTAASSARASRVPSGARMRPRRSGARRRTTSSTRSPRDSSSTSSQPLESGIPRSSTTARQNRSGSSIESAVQLAVVVAVERRARAALTFAAASCSAVGFQAKSRPILAG